MLKLVGLYHFSSDKYAICVLDKSISGMCMCVIKTLIVFCLKFVNYINICKYMTKIIKLEVIPTMDDKFEFTSIVDVTEPYGIACKNLDKLKFDQKKLDHANKLHQLINNDVICHPLMGMCGNTIHCETTFGGNFKSYNVDGVTYHVTFKFN